ncbi:HEAT repeat domain-containing protein [Anabaena azotica]|uniref:HEAT repeat domain-containing protein n=1 Tax=Anabaena azotica FACHB-119 TaxID=947527 RepID=A0ABR8CZM2_9NOST|nr:HEAT repeat domain-containing protein [Anabaena azotica]MBD2499401.1 HEAT repeat domain-containing protein [Anabaena azotica FACHB-119]
MTNQLILGVTLADTPEKLVTAVKNLATAKDEAAISTLIAVFGYNNPTAAAIASTALVEMGEVAVPQLLTQIDDYNYGARAYSIRTLAAIADPRALDVLIDAAAIDFAPSVRRAAAKGLGNLHWHKLEFAEHQIALKRAWETLVFVSQDPEWSIRYAAIVGLQGLAKIPDLQQPIHNRFQEMLDSEPERSVRARILLAQSQ